MSKYLQISQEAFLSNWLKFYKLPKGDGLTLYKGISSSEPLHDYYVFDPKTSLRHSKTATENGNAYNLLLNNLPGWGTLPLRERSIIASTSEKTASSFANSQFGKVYNLIPQIDSTLVVAPYSDIWYCFSGCLQQFGLSGTNLSLKRFNVFFKEIFEARGIDDNADKTWKDFQNALAIACDTKPKNIGPISKPARSIHLVLYEEKARIIEYLNSTFSPTQNGFLSVQYPNGIDNQDFPNNEVWTDAECTLVEVNEYQKLIDLNKNLA